MLEDVGLPVTSCRLCSSRALVPCCSLGMQALTAFVSLDNASIDDVQAASLDLARCASCGLVQLQSAVPQRLLYGGNYPYQSGMNKTMAWHLRDLAGAVQDRAPLQPGDWVLDIGCNDGTLLDGYTLDVHKAGFEPSALARLAHREGERYSRRISTRYFSEDAAQGLRPGWFTAVTAIAMFYDVPDPAGFMRGVRRVLKRSGVCVVQMNDLYGLMRDCTYDIIGHEHLAVWGLGTLSHCLGQTGLEVFDVQRFPLNGGTARFWIGHQGMHPVEISVGEYRAQEEALCTPERWVQVNARIDGISRQVRQAVEQERERGGHVYIYGASTRGNAILQRSGLRYPVIEGAAEIHPGKIGLKMAGTGIPVLRDADARAKATMFLVLPYSYREQFIDQEQGFLRAGGKLLFPLPQVEVVHG